MCDCVYVYTYAYLYASVYVYLCVYVYVYVYVHTHVSMNIVCIVYAHACMYMCICTCVCLCICMHTYIQRLFWSRQPCALALSFPAAPWLLQLSKARTSKTRADFGLRSAPQPVPDTLASTPSPNNAQITLYLAQPNLDRSCADPKRRDSQQWPRSSKSRI